MARYVREGHRISVVTCTDGMQGDILNPAMDRPGVKDRMAQIRVDELARALDLLGVTEHRWLGYPDSGYVEDFSGDGTALAPDCFFNTDLEESTGRLVAVVRELRPHVLVTYPEDGGYPHPDHIRTHEVAAAAYRLAGDPDAYPEAGPPWTPQKLYYLGGFNPRRVKALHHAALEQGIESPFQRFLDRGYDLDGEDRTTTSVDVSDYLDVRDSALLAHATQIDPKSMWFAMPNELIREIYPYEDFELAHARVETRLPETSLFAGLDTALAARAAS